MRLGDSMKRLATLAVFAAGAGLVATAEPAQAQQVCCADPGLRGYQPGPPPPERFGSGLRGYVGAEYSKARLNPGTPSPRVETWTGEAAVSSPFMRGLGIQADIKAAKYTGPFGDDWITSPTLHLFTRNPYGALGGFVGFSNGDGGNLYGAGIEGQANLTGATLYGSLGFGRINDTVDSDLLAARIGGRYFLTENMRLDANVGYLRQTTGAAKSEAMVYGLGAEYQFGTFPASVHVGYRHADAKDSNIEADTLRVGVRWSFNGQTLVQRDRGGPSFNNISDIFLSN
jgi:hypothetical protein